MITTRSLFSLWTACGQGASYLPHGLGVTSDQGPRGSAWRVLRSDRGRRAEALRPAEKREVGGKKPTEPADRFFTCHRNASEANFCSCTLWCRWLVRFACGPVVFCQYVTINCRIPWQWCEATGRKNASHRCVRSEVVFAFYLWVFLSFHLFISAPSKQMEVSLLWMRPQLLRRCVCLQTGFPFIKHATKAPERGALGAIMSSVSCSSGQDLAVYATFNLRQHRRISLRRSYHVDGCNYRSLK